MAFQKGNKLGFKKREEYQGDEPEASVDDEEITVPFVSQYPEGRVSYEEIKSELDEQADACGPNAPASDDGIHPPIVEQDVLAKGVRHAIQKLPGLGVKLMFHGALKDDGGKNVQRPIPQTSREVDRRNFVRIGEDRIGVFTKDEAEYLLRVCKGAFTKVEA